MWSFWQYKWNRASLMMGYEKLLDSVSMDRKKMSKDKFLYLMGSKWRRNVWSWGRSCLYSYNKNSMKRERLALEKEVLGMYVMSSSWSIWKRIKTILL